MVPKSLPEEQQTLGTLLRMASEALVYAVYGKGLADAGFTDIRPSHGAVLRFLPLEGSRVTALAQRASMRKQSMGYLLEDMEKLGYVRMEADPEDGRARIVRFTKRGELAQRAATRLSQATEEQWSNELGARDWGITRRTLERLSEMLETEKGQWSQTIEEIS